MKIKSLLKSLLVVSLLVVFCGCQVSRDAKAGRGGRDGSGPTQPNENYGPPTKLGVLENRSIDESSGIVASRTTPGMYWTHNDSGDGPFIYAFDDHGHTRGVWKVAGATADDWEDIAIGPGPTTGTSYLYIGDIGDNSEDRSQITVYRVPEPTITAADAGTKKSNAQLTEAAEPLRLRYPDGRHNAETLIVHPLSGKLYVVTKVEFGNARVYEADPATVSEGVIKMTRVGELSVPTVFGGMLTGGAISPDGLRVAVCDYVQGYELVLPNANSAFNLIWKETLKPIPLGPREQGEAIGYRLDGRALVATSEGRPAPLIQVERR
ncbi:MAG TPA: hypothetical protein VMS31_04220 [Pyrinomonadaceae bacterium]|nr:hypothetical protein [Pyrinomonadaceae bacterium]